MPMERCGSNRRRNLSRPYTYIGKHTAQNERCGIYGIFERKKQFNDIPKVGQYEICNRNREFWCKGYYVDTVGKNTAAIKEYIANQLKQDKEADQLSVFDPNDPFKGSK